MKYDLKDNLNFLQKATNRIFKLLPSREEGANWELPLQTLIEEFAGYYHINLDHQDKIFLLICKMEGLFILTKEEDFLMFRKTIFECLSLLNELVLLCQNQDII